MTTKTTTRNWTDFLAYIEGEGKETAELNARKVQQIMSRYERIGNVDSQIVRAAAFLGFDFETEEKVFTADESRWIEIFNEMERLERSYKSLARDESGDLFALAAGALSEDGTITAELRRINARLNELKAKRLELHEVEAKLYPCDALGKHVKCWL